MNKEMERLLRETLGGETSKEKRGDAHKAWMLVAKIMLLLDKEHADPYVALSALEKATHTVEMATEFLENECW